jgi:hypothetical protein
MVRLAFESVSGDSRRTWKLINQVAKPSQGNLWQHGSKADADSMNAFFASVGQRAQEQTAGEPDYDLLPNTERTFRLQHVDDAKVARAVLRLPSWGAPGDDGLNGFVLKAALPVISHRIVQLFNMTVDSGVFPTRFKRAVVVPVPKKPGATDPDKQRPIALLSLLGKVLERLAYDQFYAHLEPQLSDAQSGFRKARSTETALHRIANFICGNMEKKICSVLVLLDLSKAFDSVKHSVICEKLRRYGCTEEAVGWIRSYLTDRIQAVRINGIESDDAHVHTGVPQGSILGPLLFLVVVNDLPEVVLHALANLFADDTELADSYDPKDERSIAALELRLNADLECVRTWLLQNSLLLNFLKTELLLIGHPDVVGSGRKPVIQLNGDVIQYSTTARNLGVVFDSEHTYKAHVDAVARAAGQKLANLGRVRALMPPAALQRAVESLVMSSVLYGISVWSACTVATLRPVQRVQNWAARVVSGRRKFDHVSDVIRELKWLRVDDEAQLRLATAAYSAMRGEWGADMAELFKQPDHHHYTRQQAAGLLSRPDRRTNRGQRGFAFAGPTVLNEQADIVQKNLTKSNFTKAVKLRITTNSSSRFG